MVTGLKWPQKRISKFRIKFEETVKTINDTNFVQDFAPLEPLKGLSFTPTTVQPQTSSARDILLSLMK